MRLQSWSGSSALSLIHNATTSELFHSTHLFRPLLSVTRLTTVPRINDWMRSNHAESQLLKPNMLPFSFNPSSVSSEFGVTPQLHPSSTLHGLTFQDHNQTTLAPGGLPCPSRHLHPNNSGWWFIKCSAQSLGTALSSYRSYRINLWGELMVSKLLTILWLSFLSGKNTPYLLNLVNSCAESKCSTNAGYKSIPPVDCGVSEVEHND